MSSETLNYLFAIPGSPVNLLLQNLTVKRAFLCFTGLQVHSLKIRQPCCSGGSRKKLPSKLPFFYYLVMLGVLSASPSFILSFILQIR